MLYISRADKLILMWNAMVALLLYCLNFAAMVRHLSCYHGCYLYSYAALQSLYCYAALICCCYCCYKCSVKLTFNTVKKSVTMLCYSDVLFPLLL